MSPNNEENNVLSGNIKRRKGRPKKKSIKDDSSPINNNEKDEQSPLNNSEVEPSINNEKDTEVNVPKVETVTNPNVAEEPSPKREMSSDVENNPESVEKRKQMKIPPFLMEKVKSLMNVKRVNYHYEIVELLVNHYSQNALSPKEQQRFELLMEMAEEDFREQGLPLE